MWTVNIGTIFPGIFPGPLGISCMGKNLGLTWDLHVCDLRSFALDKHKTVDDEPFGGGGGMIMKPDVIAGFFEKYNTKRKIYMSPRGKVFNQSMIKNLVAEDLSILCGRYEGVDVRVLQHYDVEEISIGDFILHGGELAALVLVESCARSIVVKQHSFISDTFSNGLLEHDQYTRPAKWIIRGVDSSEIKTYNVPEVLISGNHKEIEKWRVENSVERTKNQRPDLWEDYVNQTQDIAKQDKEELMKKKVSKKNDTVGGN